MPCADTRQCWADCRAGNQPAQERGVTLIAQPDDGSPGPAERYARATRAARAPVRDVG